MTPLPEVLAGPILRRVTPGEVYVWLATSVGCEIQLRVGRPGSGGGLAEVLAAGDALTTTLGPALHVHLACARAPSPLPAGEMLAYDIAVDTGTGARGLAELGLVGGDEPIAYGPGAGALPAFALPLPGAPARLLQGSCRLLHGSGEDAFGHVDALLDQVHGDPARWPQALLLTGDQIYGDEVAGPLLGQLTALGSALLGEGDARSVPGVDDLAAVPTYGRQAIAEDTARFSSGKAANHLLSLGEYAAAYLLAWNEALWPRRLPSAADARADTTGRTRWERRRLRRQYDTELQDLEVARRAIPAVRRVLASVPTYMVFDDHDVTDDWNITRAWTQRVTDSPAGRRVVANALAAFWAFQGWGNQPDTFTDRFRSTVADGTHAISTGDAGAPAAARAYEDLLWGFDRWAYVAPTSPPVVMLDTRTQRHFDSDEGAARLLDDDELARTRELCRQAVLAGGPLVLVSPVPVFGLELQERRQKFLAGKVGPYEIDFEAWHSNLEGLTRFMAMIIDEVGATRAVVLSGDVHYALNVDVSFSANGSELRIAQLVSSSFKHSGAVARTVLHLLGRAVRAEQARVGWDEPPEVEARNGLAALIDPLLSRSVNSDHWRDNAPVFLRESLADRVPGDQPHYRERRRYVAPDHRPGWYVIGENNAGLVTIDDSQVTHQLLVGSDRAADTWDASIDLDRPWEPEPADADGHQPGAGTNG